MLHEIEDLERKVGIVRHQSITCMLCGYLSPHFECLGAASALGRRNGSRLKSVLWRGETTSFVIVGGTRAITATEFHISTRDLASVAYVGAANVGSGSGGKPEYKENSVEAKLAPYEPW